MGFLRSNFDLEDLIKQSNIWKGKNFLIKSKKYNMLFTSKGTMKMKARY